MSRFYMLVMLDIFSGFFDLENGNQKLKSDLIKSV
jgi:hypothetical protein